MQQKRKTWIILEVLLGLEWPRAKHGLRQGYLRTSKARETDISAGMQDFAKYLFEMEKLNGGD